MLWIRKTTLILCFMIVMIVVLYLGKVLFRKNCHQEVLFYCYYEKNQQYKENFEYFLENVVKPHQTTMDFYIIINGNSTVNVPSFQNTTIIHRENKGYDFGAYSHCITHHVSRTYEYYMFMNSSVRGPIPSNTDWKNRFKKLFEKDVGLVGVSINMVSRTTLEHLAQGKHIPFTKNILSHVQSMFFILKKDVFLFLQRKGFFSDEEKLNNTTDLMKIIIQKEVGMSQMVLDAGWNINCILTKYQNHDYRVLKNNINTSCEDPYFHSCYFGNDIKPEEAIFHKISRLE